MILESLFRVTWTHMALQTFQLKNRGLLDVTLIKFSIIKQLGMTNLIKRREQFMTDQRSLYMDEWQLYWVCFSRQDIRECLAATNERLNCESWTNQRARTGLWTGYTSGGGGRDELMSGFCHLIGHKGSINVTDWFSVLQLPQNLHALKAYIHNLLLLHVNICLLKRYW